MNRRAFLKTVSAGAGAAAWSWAGGLARGLAQTAATPTFSNEIVIAGQAFELGHGIRVINLRDNLDYSFRDPIGGECAESASGPSGIPGPGLPGATAVSEPRPRFGFRPGLAEGGPPGSPGDPLARLAATVRQIVLHRDATFTAHHGFNVLCARGLSTHFIVNHDGGIIQGLDPLYAAYHAGALDATSVGVDLSAPDPEGHAAIYSDPAFGGVVDYTTREVVVGVINGQTRRAFTYTDTQYASLCTLLVRLSDLLGVPLAAPTDATGAVLMDALDAPQSFEGVMGHLHVERSRWDPGPGLDWTRVLACLQTDTEG
jgi:N-acetyl-anhydromuramyl-L-alanine amidase AmpD